MMERIGSQILARIKGNNLKIRVVLTESFLSQEVPSRF